MPVALRAHDSMALLIGCRQMFDRVTEAAEAIVDDGELGLYDLPRESLQRQQDQAPPPAPAQLSGPSRKRARVSTPHTLPMK